MSCTTHIPRFKSALKENKLKVTDARLQLLDVFEHSKKPLSVGELAKKLPKADKVTLYRSVESLQQKGLLRQIRLQGRQAYYETAANHHHHIVCKRCGKIADLSSCTVTIPAGQSLKQAGFTEISEHSLEFFGICTACRSRGGMV